MVFLLYKQHQFGQTSSQAVSGVPLVCVVDTRLPVSPGYFVEGGPKKHSPAQYFAVKKYLLRRESKYRG